MAPTPSLLSRLSPAVIEPDEAASPSISSEKAEGSASKRRIRSTRGKGRGAGVQLNGDGEPEPVGPAPATLSVRGAAQAVPALPRGVTETIPPLVFATPGPRGLSSSRWATPASATPAPAPTAPKPTPAAAEAPKEQDEPLSKLEDMLSRLRVAKQLDLPETSTAAATTSRGSSRSRSRWAAAPEEQEEVKPAKAMAKEEPEETVDVPPPQERPEELTASEVAMEDGTKDVEVEQEPEPAPASEDTPAVPEPVAAASASVVWEPAPSEPVSNSMPSPPPPPPAPIEPPPSPSPSEAHESKRIDWADSDSDDGGLPTLDDWGIEVSPVNTTSSLPTPVAQVQGGARTAIATSQKPAPSPTPSAPASRGRPQLGGQAARNMITRSLAANNPPSANKAGIVHSVKRSPPKAKSPPLPNSATFGTPTPAAAKARTQRGSGINKEREREKALAEQRKKPPPQPPAGLLFARLSGGTVTGGAGRRKQAQSPATATE